MSTATYHDIQRELNDHVETCPQCRSATGGLCAVADRLLDELLAASLPREDDE